MATPEQIAAALRDQPDGVWQGETLGQRTQNLFGLDPNIERPSIIPLPDKVNGKIDWSSWTAPDWVAGLAGAIATTGYAAEGNQITPEQAVNFATNFMGSGLATSKAIKTPTGVGGVDLGIVPIDTAKKINITTKLPTDETFLNAVKYTPNAEIVDDGLKISITRNQKPEQSGMESVRGGVFYLPEGSSNAKHYATGVFGYGGKEPISGETIVKNPLFVKGATGGKAPVAAYDSLMGKGAYEKMRGDVLQATRVMSIPSNQISNVEKAIRIGETLQKYGVDPSLAEYIMQNSKTGNQLPYAMQEYIVGEAARKAGHDSILGFSKKRTGEPFISELFDLREATYPTKEGGYSLRKEFTDRKELLKNQIDKLPE